MSIDNASLLIAISISGASLLVALLVGWANARHEAYLPRWIGGITLVVVSLILIGWLDGLQANAPLLGPFLGLITGTAFIYSGARVFRNPEAGPGPEFVLWLGATLCITLPVLWSRHGVALIAVNLWGATFMVLCARQYWLAREEARITLTANAILYLTAGISFLACAVMIPVDGVWSSLVIPDNPAEVINSLTCLVCMTAIGGLSLTLNQSRVARRHRKEANTDSLTGVLNRRALFSRIAETSTVPGLAVVMFDLDQFKSINDQRGHAIGDGILKQFAAVMQAEMRQDDIVARLGGEEFCVVLPGLHSDTARQVAERIRMSFAQLQIPIGLDAATATVSVGLAIGGIAETFSSVLRRADAALYEAKTAGRDQVCLAPPRLVA